MEISIAEIEICSDDKELYAEVFIKSENTVHINLKQNIHTLESWLETSSAITEAIKKMI